MSVRRVTPGPCWAVEDPGGESGWESHRPDWASAVAAAGGELGDEGPIPVVYQCAESCWEVVCGGCGGPLDDEVEYDPPGTHYGLAEAERLAAALGELCPVCTNSQQYGSVATANGAILPAQTADSPPHPVHLDQIPLFDDGTVAALVNKPNPER